MATATSSVAASHVCDAARVREAAEGRVVGRAAHAVLRDLAADVAQAGAVEQVAGATLADDEDAAVGKLQWRRGAQVHVAGVVLCPDGRGEVVGGRPRGQRVGIQLDDAVAVVVGGSRGGLAAVAGGGIDVPGGVLGQAARRPHGTLAVPADHLGGRPPGHAASAGLGVADHVAVVRPAIPGQAPKPHDDAASCGEQCPALLLVVGVPVRVGRVDVVHPIERAAGQGDAGEVKDESGGSDLDLGDNEHAAAVDHRCAGDSQRVDVAAGEVGGPG